MDQALAHRIKCHELIAPYCSPPYQLNSDISTHSFHSVIRSTRSHDLLLLIFTFSWGLMTSFLRYIVISRPDGILYFTTITTHRLRVTATRVV